MKRFFAVAVLGIAIFLLGNDVAQRAFSSAPTTKISGFSPQRAVEQASLEDQLKKLISPDEIRKQLEAAGITLEDKPGGTIWRKK